MTLCTKVLNLAGILAIASKSLELTEANADYDDTLQEALFLVKLLKSDFAQILRTQDNDTVKSTTEEENSTCSVPSDDFNSTIAMNETEVTASGVSSTNEVSMLLSTPITPPSKPDAQPTPPNFVMPPAPQNFVTPLWPPIMTPYTHWPPMMGYPSPPGPGRENFPDENNRLPYRYNRRRMMPDYYYFENFRRLNNPDDLHNAPATSQMQTTTSISSATSQATTLHVEDTTSTSLSTTIAQPSVSILPTTEQPILQITNSTNQSILPTVDFSKQPILPTEQFSKQPILPTADSSKQPILPTTDTSKQSTLTTAESAKQSTRTTAESAKQPILPSAGFAKQPSLPTADSSSQPILPTADAALSKSILSKAKSTKPSTKKKPNLKKFKPRKRSRHRTHPLVSKGDMVSVISNRNKKPHNVSRHHLRQHTTTTENYTKNYDISEVALELKKELNDTITQDSLQTSGHQDIKHQTTQQELEKITTTTMKVFLRGSSRMPIPLPENNSFCHFYPGNALCGAK